MFDSTLIRAEWQERRAAYLNRVRPWAADRMRRTSRQEKHPVYDFLFEYYSFRPSYLLRWTPGVSVRIEEAAAEELDWRAWFRSCEGGYVLPAATFQRQTFVKWLIQYLEAVAAREPFYGCFGLHEWAMVYREPEVRHPRVPLRLVREATDAVVDAAGLVRCTHYDAFRFFTPAARPRNCGSLSRSKTIAFDQPGCVHVTMDLYKWASVLAPYTSSELIADAFELALATRELDMRASPYDLRGFGFAPIRIETHDGREEYVAGQREMTGRAVPIRQRLLTEVRRLERLVDPGQGLLVNFGSEKKPIAAS